jgi:hypothetical protein
MYIALQLCIQKFSHKHSLTVDSHDCHSFHSKMICQTDLYIAKYWYIIVWSLNEFSLCSILSQYVFLDLSITSQKGASPEPTECWDACTCTHTHTHTQAGCPHLEGYPLICREGNPCFTVTLANTCYNTIKLHDSFQVSFIFK